ncbi:MAG: hypothetical protein CBC13_04115 [Planctomycetia bacterium TMED53]|nr:MAG: hypothetical protein CBC13_04115 [Planctomycetia bacterium TMED53]
MNYDQESDLDGNDLEKQTPQQELLNKSQKTSKVFNGCFGVFLILFFIAWYVGIGFIFEEASEAKDAANWPTTSGKVVETKVTSHTSRGSGNRKSRTSYTPLVLYRYNVAEQALENDVVQMMSSYDSRAEAKKVTALYPVGSEVTVYYKLEQPGTSVLVPGISDESQLVLTIFTYVPITLLSLFVLSSIIKRMRK